MHTPHSLVIIRVALALTVMVPSLSGISVQQHAIGATSGQDGNKGTADAISTANAGKSGGCYYLYLAIVVSLL